MQDTKNYIEKRILQSYEVIPAMHCKGKLQENTNRGLIRNSKTTHVNVYNYLMSRDNNNNNNNKFVNLNNVRFNSKLATTCKDYSN